MIRKNISVSGSFATLLAGLLTCFPARPLSLWRSARIDDKAAQYLLRMKTLEILDVSDTNVTDKFLDRLEGMKQLKALFIAARAHRTIPKSPPRLPRRLVAKVQGSQVRGRYPVDRIVDLGHYYVIRYSVGRTKP